MVERETGVDLGERHLCIAHDCARRVRQAAGDDSVRNLALQDSGSEYEQTENEESINDFKTNAS